MIYSYYICILLLHYIPYTQLSTFSYITCILLNCDCISLAYILPYNFLTPLSFNIFLKSPVLAAAPDIPHIFLLLFFNIYHTNIFYLLSCYIYVKYYDLSILTLPLISIISICWLISLFCSLFCVNLLSSFFIQYFICFYFSIPVLAAAPDNTAPDNPLSFKKLIIF